MTDDQEDEWVAALHDWQREAPKPDGLVAKCDRAVGAMLDRMADQAAGGQECLGFANAVAVLIGNRHLLLQADKP